MPSIATQTSPTMGANRQLCGMLTPPDTIRTASSCSSATASKEALHGLESPYQSAKDAFMRMPESARPRVRARMGKRTPKVPPIHIHFEHVHLGPPSAPPSPKPVMVDAGVQAGDSQVPKANPNTLFNRIKRFFRPLRPLAGWLFAIGMFFLERVGFGIRLN